MFASSTIPLYTNKAQKIIMRRYLLLVLVLLGIAIAGCDSEEKITGEVTKDSEEELADSEDGGGFLNKLKNEIGIVLLNKVIDRESQLEELEAQQLEIFAERSELLKEKRDLLDKVTDTSISFKDRQVYQKTLGLVKAKESELTFRATILESRMRSLKKALESGESLEILEITLQDLNEELDEKFEKLKELGTEIIEIRENWEDKLLSLEDFDEMLEKLDPLENTEKNVMTSLANIKKRINETKENIQDFTNPELPDDLESLYVKRYRVSEELSVVRNQLVELYLAVKNAVGDGRESLNKKLDSLDKQERNLKRELREVDRKIEEKS